MYVDFESLKESSRIWIYQSSREFTAQEISEIGVKLEGFINEWTRHGDNLKGSYEIKYNHFRQNFRRLLLQSQ